MGIIDENPRQVNPSVLLECGLAPLWEHTSTAVDGIDKYYTVEGNFCDLLASVGNSGGAKGHPLIRIYNGKGEKIPNPVCTSLKSAGAEWDRSRRQYSFHLTNRRMVADMLRVFGENSIRMMPQVVVYLQTLLLEIGK